MNQPDLIGYHANGVKWGYARQREDGQWVYLLAAMSVMRPCDSREAAIQILKALGCVRIVDKDGREVEE